jgi:hypothetical protein
MPKISQELQRDQREQGFERVHFLVIKQF